MFSFNTYNVLASIMTAELPLKNSATIIWAQRLDRLFLTVELQDLTIEELKCQGNHFHIKGQNQEAKYDIDLELFDEVKEEYKQVCFLNQPRNKSRF